MRLRLGMKISFLLTARKWRTFFRSSDFIFSQQLADGCCPYSFWRRFAEIENVVAIKIAPFNRYQTLDVVRAVAESGRDIALYTGNDDNIVLDLLTPFSFTTKTDSKGSSNRAASPAVSWAIGRFGRSARWSYSMNVTHSSKVNSRFQRACWRSRYT